MYPCSIATTWWRRGSGTDEDGGFGFVCSLSPLFSPQRAVVQVDAHAVVVADPRLVLHVISCFFSYGPLESMVCAWHWPRNQMTPLYPSADSPMCASCTCSHIELARTSSRPPTLWITSVSNLSFLLADLTLAFRDCADGLLRSVAIWTDRQACCSMPNPTSGCRTSGRFHLGWTFPSVGSPLAGEWDAR